MRSQPFSTLLSTAALLAAVACSPAPEPAPEAAPAETTPTAPIELASPEGVDAAADEITADYLESVTARLSDDELKGRLPGTPGDATARGILIEEMQAMGLEPGASDGTWEQAFEIVGITSEAPETWSFQTGDESVDLAWSEDFIAASGVQDETATIEDAELVFVGYGIDAPEHDWNDYADVDVTGKVLVMLNNDPDWSPELFEGERRLYYGRWTYKYEIAAQKGAAGAIIIHTPESAGYGWQVVQSSWTGEQFQLPAGDEARTQIEAWTTEDAATRLLAAGGHDLATLVESARSTEFSPVPLGITTSLALSNEISRGVETANVIGVLPGSDPELADQAVVYTAHHDHLGEGQPDEDGDTIYNGARDNASGCAQVLAVAKALKALPEAPRRSSVFLFVAAEEQGLLGSAWYARNPTFPAGAMAANVNLDAGNIFGRTEDLIFIGYGKSDLDPIVEAAAALQDREVVGDQYPDKGFFYRSDQFNLAKIGVPAVYADGGTRLRDSENPEAGAEKIAAWEEQHYHQQSDELDDSWNFEGLVEDARAAFRIGLHVAQQEAMPAWTPGDEFEAARQEALDAL